MSPIKRQLKMSEMIENSLSNNLPYLRAHAFAAMCLSV